MKLLMFSPVRHEAALGVIIGVYTAFLGLLLPPCAQASDRGVLHRSPRPGEQVKEVQWSNRNLKVSLSDSEQPSVELTGVFRKPEWSLVYGDKKVTINQSTGEFRLHVSLTGKITRITFQAISPFGIVQTERVAIAYEGWDQWIKRKSNPKNNPLSLSAGVGLTSSLYEQSQIDGITQRILTLKVSLQKPIFGEKGLWGTTAFLSVLPLQSDRTDLTARFFGINTRVGYGVLTRPSWQLSILGGAYYTTMFTTGYSIGYSNIFGPMLYPVIRKSLSTRNSLAAYAKISPVTDGISVLAISNRELAGGISISHQLRSGNSLAGSLDLADFKLTLQGISVRNRTLSAGISYGW